MCGLNAARAGREIGEQPPCVRAEADQRLKQLVARALAEDVGGGDITAEAIVPATAGAARADRQKAAGGRLRLDAVAREALRQPAPSDFDGCVVEDSGATRCRPGRCSSSRAARAALLAAERTALNFLGHLSGVATLTARFVEAVAGTGARILDTRKTTPGLRALEKAAVAAGGGVNHRMGLYDAILIKENHIALAGGLARGGAARAREAQPRAEIEVECRDLERGRRGARPPAPTGCCSTTWTPPRWRAAVRLARERRRAAASDARGLGRRQPRERARGRRDRGRRHLGRRADPLGAGARPQHAAEQAV